MPENTLEILAKVVTDARCFPNWAFRLIDEDGAHRLVITIEGQNNYHPEQPFIVSHYHPVPITTYNEKSWRRWIFEQCRRSMTHEIGEALRWPVADDIHRLAGAAVPYARPFAPMHGPGEDPYTAHEIRTERDALTTQDGSLREGPV